MSDESTSLIQLVRTDDRYPIEAYLFVRESLAFAADSMELGAPSEGSLSAEQDTDLHQSRRERHLTGQELCESIRQYAINQYGFMAQIVLNRWGIFATQDFGEIVYRMIDAGIMKKSSRDRKSHFDDVFEFDSVFQDDFEMCSVTAARKLT